MRTSTRTRKKKRKKTTSGIKRNRAPIVAVSAAVLLGIFAGPGFAEHKRPKQAVDRAYAVVGGTVFRESGLSLPGVEVVLMADPDTPGAPAMKRQKQVTDARGEFAFRVPPDPMRYNVSASAKGFLNQQKSVLVNGPERAEVTLTLLEPSNK